jgi:hypothetical protein
MAIDPRNGQLNLGNEKLNINTSTAKGLERSIGMVGIFVVNAQAWLNSTLYGKYEIQTDENKNGIEKALDRGLLTIMKELASFDFCSIFNFLTNQATGTIPKFDPKNPPSADEDPAALKLWKVQKKAFDYQKIIDDYYGAIGVGAPLDRLKKRNFSYENKKGNIARISGDTLEEVQVKVLDLGGDISTIKEEKNALQLIDILGQLNLAFDFLLSKQGLGDPDFKVIPKLSNLVNYLTSIKGQYAQYVLTGIIPNTDLKKINDDINKVRTCLVLIQSLNRPGSAISLFNNITGGKYAQQILDLNKIVTPGPQVIILIKRILKKLNRVNSVAKKTLGIISTVKAYIKLLILLVKIFNAIRAGIFAIASVLPSLFTPQSAGLTFNEIYQEKLNREGVIKFITRLEQIKSVMIIMISFVTNLVAALTIIIQNLELILLNIQSCQPDLAKEIQSTIDELQDSKQQLQKFLDDANSANNRISNTFGGYTIEIVTEELADEGIKLKRRYGIARGGNSIVAVESTPTFASLDLIIINEVKVLLVSKGLVNIGITNISPEQIVVVSDTLNYLGDESIDLSNIQVTAQDLSNLGDSGDSLGLSSFVNNLPGGKALRKKVRKKLADANKNLGTNLKSTDPNGKYNTNIIKS